MLRTYSRLSSHFRNDDSSSLALFEAIKNGLPVTLIGEDTTLHRTRPHFVTPGHSAMTERGSGFFDVAYLDELGIVDVDDCYICRLTIDAANFAFADAAYAEDQHRSTQIPTLSPSTTCPLCHAYTVLTVCTHGACASCRVSGRCAGCELDATTPPAINA